MTPDTTRDSAPDERTFTLTITEAARFSGLSVRTIQRKLDKTPPEWEAVTVAGKRCVILPASALEKGMTRDATRADLSGQHSSQGGSQSSTLALDVTRDFEGDTIAGTERGTALVAAIVSETLSQVEARAGQRHAAPDAAQIAAKLLLTLSEAQTLTGLSRAVLRAAIDGGQLKASQIGRAWRIKRSALEQYVEAL